MAVLNFVILISVMFLTVLSTTAAWKVILYKHTEFRGAQLELEGEGCQNVPKNFKDKTSSVNTLGECIRLYEHKNCMGRVLELFPGSGTHANLKKHRFNDVISSVGNCPRRRRSLNLPPPVELITQRSMVETQDATLEMRKENVEIEESTNETDDDTGIFPVEDANSHIESYKPSVELVETNATSKIDRSKFDQLLDKIYFGTEIEQVDARLEILNSAIPLTESTIREIEFKKPFWFSGSQSKNVTHFKKSIEEILKDWKSDLKTLKSKRVDLESKKIKPLEAMSRVEEEKSALGYMFAIRWQKFVKLLVEKHLKEVELLRDMRFLSARSNDLFNLLIWNAARGIKRSEAHIEYLESKLADLDLSVARNHI